MDLSHVILVLLAGLLMMVVVLGLIRARAIPPSAVLLWLCICLLVISIPFFEEYYRVIANKIIGFDDARHMFYVFSIFFLLVYSLYLTIKISQLSNYINILMSEFSIMEMEFHNDEEKRK